MKRFDKKTLAASFARAAKTYEKSAILQKEVGKRLLERLSYFKMKPKKILDLGAGTLGLTRILKKQAKPDTLIALDLSWEALAYGRRSWFESLTLLAADGERLPFPDNTFDCVFSNMTIHWANDFQALFSEIKRVLKPEGIFLFASLGEKTFYELKSAWLAADEKIHVHAFYDLSFYGDLLLKSGFQDPVVDYEEIILEYSDILPLMRDIKGTGAHNLDNQRLKGLTGKNAFQTMQKAYESFRNERDKLPLTYEIIYGQAFAGTLKTENTGKEIKIPVNAIKRGDK